MIGAFAKKLFGSANDRVIKSLRKTVDAINALEPDLERLSDVELRTRTDRFRERLAAGEKLDEVLVEAFATVREATKRTLAQRHFDVQLMGGMVLHRGSIAEQRTGEGKTFVAPLAAYLNALVGRGVHVVTPNDYLAKRDAQWIGAIFHRLGMSVGSIQHDAAYMFDPEFPQTDERLRDLRPATRSEANAADVTYGTNNEFGFDFLRDNLVIELTGRSQRGHFFGIVDEVDNILIDEARTPLIISGNAEESADKYLQFAGLVPRLTAEEDYVVDVKFKQVAITEAGTDKMEGWLGVENMFADDFSLARHLEQALKAEVLYKKDKEYVVKDGEVVIVDEFTSRLMPGRRWSEGLHQAVEAKEGVAVRSEQRTLATVTFQNYFRMYDKLAGMTGTAETEAEEFAKIYNLEVVVIPTHREMIRADYADLVYANQKGKWNSVIEEIAEEHDKGRPVLVGTISVEISEMLGDMLKRRGIKHSVLNAKFHEKEAEIVAQAGRSGAVTIATNMAGRGTDILLGGNPEVLAADLLHKEGTNVLEATPEQYAEALAEAERVCAEDKEKVLAAGGMHILGTERHEARRIDNQLRGRAGRQGDPGSSRFYLSLEDDLMKRFASDRVQGIMRTLGFTEDTALESKMVSKTIENAQSRVEGYNFDTRKHVVEYDDVINRQRETIYRERDRILRSSNLGPTIEAMLDDEVATLVGEHTAADHHTDWNLEVLRTQLTTMVPSLTDADLRFLDEAREGQAVTDQLTELIRERYERKRAETGEQGIGVLERLVMLRVIDSLWVEHLTAIDDMRRGIGLRAYSQRDPLNEFKIEAYRMFDELKTTIRHDVTHTIFRVTVQQQPAQPRPMARNVIEGRAAVGGATSSAAGAATATAVAGGGNGSSPARSGPKIGRNDPCYCGSGIKYKKCHGA